MKEIAGTHDKEIDEPNGIYKMDEDREHKNGARCGLFLHYKKFHRDRSKRDGLSSYCKKCSRQIQRESRIIGAPDA